MKTKAVKILIISHDASRTGAPILLLNLVKGLKLVSDYKIDFLMKKGGVLIDDFVSLAPTYSLEDLKITFLTRVQRKIFPKRSKPFANVLSKIDWSQYDLVISNTITNGNILPLIRSYFKGRIISYIHELEMASKLFTSQEQIKSLIKVTNQYAVPSFAVKLFLEQQYHINPENIKLLPYFIPSNYIETTKNSVEQKSAKKVFYVGGVGTVDWRKSPDLFIQTAFLVYKKMPEANIVFAWKGTAPNTSVELARLEYDIKKLQLTDKIEFIAASANLIDFYDKIDVLLLTSREDPYPLVVLEAADAAVPTICFKEAGGAPEFVNSSGGGSIVNYLDTDAMAQTILFYYKNTQERSAAGKAAKKQLSNTHQDPFYILNQFNLLIEE